MTKEEFNKRIKSAIQWQIWIKLGVPPVNVDLLEFGTPPDKDKCRPPLKPKGEK